MTSPQQPDREAAVGTASALTEALTGLSRRLDAVKEDSEARDSALEKRARQNRHRIWLSYVLIAIDVILTVLLVVIGIGAADASSSAGTANDRAAAAAAATGAEHDALISSCDESNQERAQELAIWEYLFRASKPTSAQQAAQIASFMKIVDAAFAPKNCAQVYSLTPKGK